MGTYLRAMLLPISKATAKGFTDTIETMKIFGFNEWVNSPLNTIFNTQPEIRSELENEFRALFNSPNKLNLDDFINYSSDTVMKYKIRSDIGLTPFYRLDFISSKDYVQVFMLLIEPKLAIQLPTEINGVEIRGKNNMYSSVVPLTTLQNTDLDELKNSIESAGDDYLKERKWALDEIIDGLKEAKKREWDFFAWIG